jgi:hypothetical protein
LPPAITEVPSNRSSWVWTYYRENTWLVLGKPGWSTFTASIKMVSLPRWCAEKVAAPRRSSCPGAGLGSCRAARRSATLVLQLLQGRHRCRLSRPAGLTRAKGAAGGKGGKAGLGFLAVAMAAAVPTRRSTWRSRFVQLAVPSPPQHGTPQVTSGEYVANSASTETDGYEQESTFVAWLADSSTNEQQTGRIRDWRPSSSTWSVSC